MRNRTKIITIHRSKNLLREDLDFVNNFMFLDNENKITIKQNYRL